MSPYFPQRPPTLHEVNAAIAGDAFPGDVTDGRLFYRTDLGAWFQRIAAISAWLGPREKLLFGNNATGLNNVYMRGISSIIPSGANYGYWIPDDVYIVGFTAVWTVGVTSGTWRVRRDAVNNTAVPHPGGTIDSISDMTLGTLFSSDARMQVYMDTFNTGISLPTCMVFYRRTTT